MRKQTAFTLFLLLTIVSLVACGSTPEPEENNNPLTIPTAISSNGGPPPTFTVPVVATITLPPAAVQEATPTLAPTATATATPTATPEASATPPVLTLPDNIENGLPALPRDLLFVTEGGLGIRDQLRSSVNLLLAAEGTAGVTAIDFTADGERLVAARQRETEGQDYELFRVDIGNALVWKLADAPRLVDFSVSPNGRFATYVAGGRPYPAGELVTAMEAEAADLMAHAGTVYRVDMETRQTSEVGQCVDIPPDADWSPEFLGACSGLLWTVDSQNMLWADVIGLWLHHQDATEPTLFLANPTGADGIPLSTYHPLSFAKNGRYLLMQQIVFEALEYVVLDLVTRQVLPLPGSNYGIATGYSNVNWMQDDRLFLLRQKDDSGSVNPTLELWRIGENNVIRREETTQLTLPPHRQIRDVAHFTSGRFGFVLQADNPAMTGFYLMASSNEQPQRINGLYDPNSQIHWLPDGNGVMIAPSPGFPGLYAPTNYDREIDQFYDVRPHLGDAHHFAWRP